MRLSSRLVPAAVALAMALPTSGTAQTTNVTFKSDWQALLGGYAIGPLKMQQTGLTSTFDVFCIDRDNGIDAGDNYNVRILTFEEAVSTTASYNGITNRTALQKALGNSGYSSITSNTTTTLSNGDYFKRMQAAASLTNQFGPTPTNSWDELQYAIWALFSTSVGQTPNNTPTTAGSLFATALANASSTTNAWTDYKVIVDARAWNQNDVQLKQTFITRSVSTVPEPSTYALMGAGLLGLWAASRRRGRTPMVS